MSIVFQEDNLKFADAVHIGENITHKLLDGDLNAAYDLLKCILTQKIPFRILERIGQTFGVMDIEIVNPFLDRIAEGLTMGGWVVIGGALKTQLESDLSGAFDKAKQYLIKADVWYGADIIGERVPGPGLVSFFDPSIALLKPWREHENRWVRRTIGVAVHYWAKRAKGDPNQMDRAKLLLDLLAPLFSEWEMDAAKGIGWGIKTIGKYYPELLLTWLPGQMKKKHRTIIVRKAVTYLSTEQRELLHL